MTNGFLMGLDWVKVGYYLQCVGYATYYRCIYVHVRGLWREGGRGNRGNGCFFHFIIAWGSSGFALHSVAYCGQSSCMIQYDTIPVLTFSLFLFSFLFHSI